MTPTLHQLLDAISLVALLLTGCRLVFLRRLSRDSTAETARIWALAALLFCVIASVVRFVPELIPARFLSALHYFATVMLLTPLIAILGARRPGANAWPWFVILPLIVVLQWPSVSQLMSGQSSLPIEIPTPTILGFLFVLFMGSGNYFGTANTGPMLIGTSAVIVMVLPASEWMNGDNAWAHVVAAVLIMIAIRSFSVPAVQSSTNASVVERANTVWISFRDMYGIVWSKRAMDRINQLLNRESLPVVLTLDGFTTNLTEQHSGSGSEKADEVSSESVSNMPTRAVVIFCWVMKRFVDRAFLKRYLPDELIGEWSS